MQLATGLKLDERYRLDAVIGEGGMASVYRAFDLVLEREVAVKVTKPEIARDPEQLERLRREARAVAQLSHPHIVGVIDVGEQNGLPFVVFEFVYGQTLKQRIREAGPLAIDEALAYAIEIARGLEAAHAHGIVHRDIKPQNILIDEEGFAKVTDFGIARSSREHELTRVGRVLGTTEYLSPEQALGHDVCGQADIYSLGVVLYEMLTGVLPFRADTAIAVAMRHVHDEFPDIQEERAGIPALVAKVVERMCAKDRDGRYQTMADVIRDLEDALATEVARRGHASPDAAAIVRTLSGSSRSKLPATFRWRPLTSLMAAIALIVGVGVLLLLEHPTEVSNPAPTERVPRPARATFVNGLRAYDYDPLGDGHEHPAQTKFVLDGDPATSWQSERYTGGVLNKAGTGLYLEARTPEPFSAVAIETLHRGWRVELYGALDQPPKTIPAPGWNRIGGATLTHQNQRLRLSSPRKKWRYILLWITGLPPQANRVEISRVRLLKKTG